MQRSISTRAIVIRRVRSGDFHKSLTLLTEDRGLVTATAYGAYKMHSHLRMASEPFTVSRALLYLNPVKGTFKVTDFELLESFRGLADLSRLAAASLWAEVAQKSFGAGETSSALFQLFRSCLRALDASSAQQEPYVTVQFLWRFLGLAGYQPATDACDRCGAALGGTKSAYFSAVSNSLQCAACGSQMGRPLPAGSLRYLEATSELPVERALEVRVEAAGLRALRDALPRMVQAVLEGELVSLPWVGAGR